VCRQVPECSLWRSQSIRREFTVYQRAALTESDEIMNPKFGVLGLCLIGLTIVNPVQAADTNAVAGRVGVYDSRAVAYAWFCSDAQMAQLKEQMATARAAQQAGDQTKLKEYSTTLKAKQDQMHREVFSIAPAAEALAALSPRLLEIEQAAGVTNLVSKWDDPVLSKYKDAKQVDVTDALVHALIQPTEKQSKMIESIEKAEPVPLEKCNELIKKDEL
jgi:hypothetical protein